MNRLIEAAEKGIVWNAYLIVGSHLDKVRAVAREYAGHLSLTPNWMVETKMENIREMLADVNIKPDAGARKVYVLPTDEMSERSQNAILKTLEDPPDYAVFLLLSTNLMIPLPTIKSRCVIYHCPPDHTILEELENRKVIDPSLYERYSFGSVEKAISLAQDPSFLENRASVLRFLTGYLQGRLMPLAKEEKKDAPIYVFYLLLFFQDVVSPAPFGWYADQPDLILRYRKHFTTRQILSMIDITKETDQLMHKNTNPQYVWDRLQVGLMEVFHG